MFLQGVPASERSFVADQRLHGGAERHAELSAADRTSERLGAVHGSAVEQRLQSVSVRHFQVGNLRNTFISIFC